MIPWRRLRLAHVRAAAYLALARLALATLGFGHVRHGLQRRVRHAHRADAAQARATAATLRGVARHLPLRTSCLDRGIALWWLLARDGVASELRIGVKRGEPLDAHAWVECAGEALELDDTHRGYEPFDAPLLETRSR